MTTKTWRDVARATIQTALQEAEAQGLDAAATKAYVNSCYPFGERAYYPYQVWLNEMKRAFGPAKGPAKQAQSDMAKLKAWNEGKAL